MEVIRFGPQDSKFPPTIFLHGFPGLRSKQNRVFAESFSEKTGKPALLVLYSGLGFAKGTFSFSETKSEVLEFFSDLCRDYEGQFDLVGHSWGGFLALNLAAQFPERVNKLVLMSPLLKFFPVDVSADSFGSTARDNADLRLGDIEKLARDFVEVGSRESMASIVSRIPSSVDVTILQSEEDQITPLKVAEETVSLFSHKPALVKLKTDHSFLVERDSLIDRVINTLEA